MKSNSSYSHAESGIPETKYKEPPGRMMAKALMLFIASFIFLAIFSIQELIGLSFVSIAAMLLSIVWMMESIDETISFRNQRSQIFLRLLMRIIYVFSNSVLFTSRIILLPFLIGMDFKNIREEYRSLIDMHVTWNSSPPTYRMRMISLARSILINTFSFNRMFLDQELYEYVRNNEDLSIDLMFLQFYRDKVRRRMIAEKLSEKKMASVTDRDTSIIGKNNETR